MNAIIQDLIHGERFHPGPIWHGARATGFARVVKVLRLWSERSIQRRHLARLTPEALKDIGISPAAAAAEVDKPFWQA